MASCLMPSLSQTQSEGPADSPWTTRSLGTPWTKPLKMVLRQGEI